MPEIENAEEHQYKAPSVALASKEWLDEAHMREQILGVSHYEMVLEGQELARAKEPADKAHSVSTRRSVFESEVFFAGGDSFFSRFLQRECTFWEQKNARTLTPI